MLEKYVHAELRLLVEEDNDLKKKGGGGEDLRVFPWIPQKSFCSWLDGVKFALLLVHSSWSKTQRVVT